ncbi:hypothetical protein L1987_03108 [Smallanthus sonchifolius]|uniref:Uncharacterized protein n=1 Tax=Smallanthus sonchifolius TaxID=185202 RepID=A0ACB9K9X9_9ASTR|nr:hypothetical protein L1987_03108 [Smallanthus sonchifolius]
MASITLYCLSDTICCPIKLLATISGFPPFLKMLEIKLGDVISLATIPTEMEVEAYFLAKDGGIVARIALAEMIFNEVNHTLKDGDNVIRGLKIDKVHDKK